MVSNSAAKYETKLLQKQKLQNIKTSLNWSWLYLKKFTDDQKILLTHLHLQYGGFVGTTIASICESLKISPKIVSQVEAVITKALIKADKFYFISNFRLPVDCLIRSFSHFYNLKLPIPARVGSLYIQSLIPPYIEDLWVPEDLVEKYYTNYLLDCNIITKDLYGFRILI